MATPANTKGKSNKGKGDIPKQPKQRGQFFRGLGSELKKVNWPTFGKVCKTTGIVLLVSLCFLLVVTAIDAGLGELYKLMIAQF